MLFAFTSRGFYIIDCQDSPNIIFDFAHHRFLHETGLERHFSTASLNAVREFSGTSSE